MKYKVMSILLLNTMLICSMPLPTLANQNTSILQVENNQTNRINLKSATPVYIGSNFNFNKTNQPLDITNEQNIIETFKNNASITILIEFNSNNLEPGSLFSVSNSNEASSHFHIYTQGEVLGFELRGARSTNSGNITRKDIGITPGKKNTMALTIDNNEEIIEVYLNGKRIIKENLNVSIKDINGIDKVFLGKTPRKSSSNKLNEYLYDGSIESIKVYDKAILGKDLLEYTSQSKFNEYKQIFNEKETYSKFYRIPAMYTLSDGTVMASIDARFADSADSPNNIDIAMRTLPNGSNTWSEVSFPFYFEDFTETSGRTRDSASFIDTNIVQGLDGTIHLTVDAFPAGYGYPNAKAGSGYKTINGEKYLALTKGGNVEDFSSFDYYIKDGSIYNKNNEKTNYTIDEKFNLYENGSPLMIKQKDINYGSIVKTDKEIPMNIFYKDSIFKVYATSYLWTISSKDNGKTWSNPKDLNFLKRENERFMGTGPGRGLTLTKGEYKGRILVPIYDSEDGERSSVIYSDDNGLTWKRGNRVTLSSSNSPGKASESQLVEMPDGRVRVYARGSTKYIGYADSFDGGVTFEPMQQDKNLLYGHSGSGCMISVINYSQKIDGKDVLILSSPEGPNRNNGIIRVGLINEQTKENGKIDYTVDWKYKTKVNFGEFQYSCLTELPNGNIAILYETSPSASKSIYKEYTLEELTTNINN